MYAARLQDYLCGGPEGLPRAKKMKYRTRVSDAVSEIAFLRFLEAISDLEISQATCRSLKSVTDNI